MNRINPEYFNALMREPLEEERMARKKWCECLADAQAATDRQRTYEQARSAALHRRRERQRHLRQRRINRATVLAAAATVIGIMIGVML